MLVRRINQLYHDLTQDVFDHAHRYRHRVEREFWQDVRLLLNNACNSDSTGRTVVDLACGTGFVTQILAEALRPRDRLIAVDISTAALATTARKCASSRLELTVADGAALPLPGESVDLFAINAALHHMPDPPAVLGEVHRVLKPGGWFAMGFEPNQKHFSSPMGRISRGTDRLAWYASPRQNLRRLRGRLGLADSNSLQLRNDDRVSATINDILLREQAIAEPLATTAILDCVDPHARGADEHAGFNAVELIGKPFVGYEVNRLVSCDYLGEAARRFRTLRALADAGLRTVLPAHGSLFSCILRKPAVSRPAALEGQVT
jgi:SAM-dependent methyltransferase